jgi:hypothetical protein
MNRSVIILFFFISIGRCVLFSQYIDYTPKPSTIIDPIAQPFTEASWPKNVSSSQGIGISTNISGFWDLQSNGGAINYIEMNPSNPDLVHVVMMASTDSIDPISVSMSRKVFYNFSYDGGNSWGSPVSVPSNRSGYPSLALVLDQYLSSVAAVANHGAAMGNSPLQSFLYLDISEGAKSFLSYPSPLALPGNDDAIWPQITQTTNGNIILAASYPPSSSLSGLSIITFTTDGDWGSWVKFETSSNHGGRIAIASGDDGHAAVIWRASTDPDSLLYRETTDDGNSWTQKSVVTRENGNEGPCWTGFDAIYIGSTLYVTYTTSKYDIQGYKLANRVMVWNSDTKTSSVVIDSLRFPKIMKSTGNGKVQTNHNFAFNFPSIGKNTTGSRLYIAVDAFLQDVTDYEGYNYSDILLTYSDDFGTTWQPPRNICRTNNLDERYVSISTVNPLLNVNGNDSEWVYLVFQEDKIPGANYVTTSSAPEARPVSRAALKFFKYNVDAIEQTSVAINTDNSWNMLSIPIDSSLDKINAFPSASSNAFTLIPGSGYVPKAILDAGKGYWLKFNTSDQFIFEGARISNKIVTVSNGWNMIGAISTPLLVSQVITNPENIISSHFYKYKNGYSTVDTLFPGKGYWIKVNQAGEIILRDP